MHTPESELSASSEGELQIFSVAHFGDMLPEQMATVVAFMFDRDPAKRLAATRALWRNLHRLDLPLLVIKIENQWARIRDGWLAIKPGSLPVLRATIPAFLYDVERKATAAGVVANYFHGLPGKDYLEMVSYIRRLGNEIARMELIDFIDAICEGDEPIMRAIRGRVRAGTVQAVQPSAPPMHDLPEDPPFHGGGDLDRVAGQIRGKQG